MFQVSGHPQQAADFLGAEVFERETAAALQARRTPGVRAGAANPNRDSRWVEPSSWKKPWNC